MNLQDFTRCYWTKPAVNLAIGYGVTLIGAMGNFDHFFFYMKYIITSISNLLFYKYTPIINQILFERKKIWKCVTLQKNTEVSKNTKNLRYDTFSTSRFGCSIGLKHEIKFTKGL